MLKNVLRLTGHPQHKTAFGIHNSRETRWGQGLKSLTLLWLHHLAVLNSESSRQAIGHSQPHSKGAFISLVVGSLHCLSYCREYYVSNLKSSRSLLKDSENIDINEVSFIVMHHLPQRKHLRFITGHVSMAPPCCSCSGSGQ